MGNHNPYALCTTKYVGDRIHNPTNRRDGRIRNVVVQWGEVKDQVRAVLERGEVWDSQPSGFSLKWNYDNPSKKTVWSESWEYEFDEQGRPTYTDGGRRKRHKVLECLGSAADINYWMRHGFRSPQFENLADRVPAALQSRPSWSDEEGDVDLGRMAAGWDDFYLGMAERPTKPGVRVQIEMVFAAMVKQDVVEQYGAWVNSLLGSMEAYGIDMVIDLWMPIDGVYSDYNVRTNTLLRVKNSNEVSDFTDWSILFSPAGWRQIGFAALCVGGDKTGNRVDNSYGMSVGGKTWGLEYDREESVVSITCNQRAAGNEAIPFDALNRKAIAAGLIPDPEALKS